MAFFFTSYVNPDGAAGLMVEVLKPQAFVLRTDHLICLSINHLGRIRAVLFLKTIHRKRQFLGIVGSLTDSYSHNQSLSRISRELDVVARRNGSIP